MLNITRTWNAMASVWSMRRCIALAKSYAKSRYAFGTTLDKKPLHQSTLAMMLGEFNGAFVLAFKIVELLGKIETNKASSKESALFRILAPLAKLTTAKQAVSIASETMEAFGGAGYIEDTGIPKLLSDAQVLPIWEGTTNVLSMDILRVSQKSPESLKHLLRYPQELDLDSAPKELDVAIKTLLVESKTINKWVDDNFDNQRQLESNARLLSLSLGRLMQLALLIEHSCQMHKQNINPSRSITAAKLFASHRINQFREANFDDIANICDF